MDEAEVLQLFDLRALDDVLDAQPGRVGAARVRKVLLRHDVGSTLTRSELEERFLALCRRSGLPLPAVNARVAGFAGRARAARGACGAGRLPPLTASYLRPAIPATTSARNSNWSLATTRAMPAADAWASISSST